MWSRGFPGMPRMSTAVRDETRRDVAFKRIVIMDVFWPQVEKSELLRKEEEMKLSLSSLEPKTRNPKPETRNPKPETRNPKSETRSRRASCCGRRRR